MDLQISLTGISLLTILFRGTSLVLVLTFVLIRMRHFEDMYMYIYNIYYIHPELRI